MGIRYCMPILRMSYHSRQDRKVDTRPSIRARLGPLQRIEIAKKLLIRFFTSRIEITTCATLRESPGLEGAPVKTCLRLIRQDHLFKMYMAEN